MKISRFILLSAAALTTAVSVSALTYTYSGAQTAMNQAQAPVATYDTVEWNITSGYFGTSGARSQTYANPNLIFTAVVMNNGWGEAVTRFSSATTVTGAGPFTLASAGLGQDFVFAGNMQGYSGAVNMGDFGDATLTLGGTGSNVVQYGGETAGGNVALGTVTTDGTGNWINNVAGSGALTVNNVVFNYGTSGTYDYVKVTNAISQRDSVNFTGNANVVASGVISGAGALNKSGTGTLTLTGVNTYTGATTIAAGTLAIGEAGQLGSGTYAGAIANAGTLNYNSTANQTLSGVISGAGALVKDNTGTLTLSGANTYTGSTTVNAGTLVFNNASAVTLSGALNGAGAVTKQGAGTLALTGGGTYSGALTVSAGTLSVGGNLASVGSVTVASGAALATSGTGTLTAGTLAFEGTGTITFGTLTNYTSSSALSATTVTLGGGAGSVTLNLGTGIIASNTYHLISHNGSIADLSAFTLGAAPTLGARQSGGLVYSASAIDYVVTGDSPKWTGAQSSEWSTAVIGGASNWQLITAGTPTDYLEGDLVLFDDTATGTTVAIAANVSPASTIFNNATKDYTLSGTAGIAGSGTLTKSGAGKLSISSQNTYTGGTTLNAGTLAVTDATSLGASSGALTFAGSATLQALAGFSTSRNYILNTGVTGTIDTNGFNLTQSGVISGTGALVKTGAGKLALATTSTYTGGTTVNGGVLDLTGGGGAVGTIRGTVTVNSGATLRLSVNDATGYNTDATRVSVINLVGGTLDVNTTANQTLGSAVINMTGGAITGVAGSNLDFFGGASALNTLASATTSTISGTKLTLRQTGGATFTVADGAAATDLEVASTVTNGTYGAQALTKAGAGLMNLSGANNYTGATNINAGTLSISGTTNGTGSVTVNGGASLVVKTGGALTTTGSLSTANATGANITVESGATLNAGSVNIAWNSSTFKVDGTLTATGDFKVSTNATTAVTGAGTINAANFTTGNAGSTVFSYSAATANLSGKVMVGDAASAGNSNTFSQTGGTINAVGLQLGYSGTTAAQTYNLTGGRINLGASGIAALGTGARNINLGAGTLGARADWSSSLAMSLTNAATGTTFNTLDSVDGVTARSITLTGGLSGAGKLVKDGAGTLALSGSNGYLGGTTITGGTLSAGSSSALGSGAVTVSGGTLATSVANVNIGAFTIDGGTLELNGAGAGDITLAAGQNLLITAGLWNVDLANGTDRIIGSGGTFSLTGGVLNLGGGAINYGTTYALITGFASGTVGGTGSIQGYDTTNWMANLDNAGVLSFTAVPEPSTYGLLGAGALAAAALVRRRRKFAKVA